MKNEILKYWDGTAIIECSREDFTKRALNSPYHSPNYLDFDYFDLTGHILLWEYIRTRIKDVPDMCHFVDLKCMGISFIDIESYRCKVLENASCFACVYAEHCVCADTWVNSGACKHCPLDWSTDSCISFDSLYNKFKLSETGKEAEEYALKIRDLPVKKGVIVR